MASGDTTDPRYDEAVALQKEEYELIWVQKPDMSKFINVLKDADEKLTAHLGKKDYTIKEVNAITTEDKRYYKRFKLHKI